MAIAAMSNLGLQIPGRRQDEAGTRPIRASSGRERAQTRGGPPHHPDDPRQPRRECTGPSAGTDEAIALGEQVREARVRNLGLYHPKTIHTLDSLAMAYNFAGKLEKALPLLKQAAAGIEKRKFADESASHVIFDLCECLDKSNQSSAADDWRRKWLAAAREKYGPDSAAYANALEGQGEGLLDSRKARGRRTDPAQCLAIRRKTQPEDWTTSQAQSLLGARPAGPTEVRRGRAAPGRGIRGPRGPQGAGPPVVRPVSPR